MIICKSAYKLAIVRWVNILRLFSFASVTGFVSTEVDRDKQTGGGIDYLINRKAFILHPRGIAYTGAVREHVETPLRAELAKAENWKPVYEPKQLRIVAIKHKIG